MKLILSERNRIVLEHDGHILIILKDDLSNGAQRMGGYVDFSMKIQPLLHDSIYGQLAMKCILDSVNV